MDTWNRDSYENSFTRNCFSGTPFCGSVGWEARWGKDGRALKDDTQIRRLVEMEFLIRPVPLWAQQIARQIDVLPYCGWGFPQHVAAVCTNIGRRDAEAARALRCFTVGPGRLALLANVALLLDGWLKRISPDAVASAIAVQESGGLDWTSIADNVYRALGDVERCKEVLVRRLLERLRFWLRAPYNWSKGDDSLRLGYLYVPALSRNGGWDYFGFESHDPVVRELNERIREQIDTPDRWLEVITSTWPCAPKVMRFLERIICTIGRVERGGTSAYDELVQSPPAAGEVLPVNGTYLDSATSRRLYETSIRLLADYVGDDFCVPVPLPDEVDVAWAARLAASLGGRAPAKVWLASLLLEKIVLYEENFRTFHFTLCINHR